MNNTDLHKLKDFILEKNPYFNTGYADAFVMPNDGRVMVYNGKDFKPIFPDDTSGDYFYLRSDEGISFALQDAQRLSDHGATKYTFTDTANFFLVAVVKDADRYELVNNLRNTCAMYKDMYAIPTSALWVRESVVANELAGIEDVLPVLRRLKNETIVRLTISLNKQYVSSECINDICNC